MIIIVYNLVFDQLQVHSTYRTDDEEEIKEKMMNIICHRNMFDAVWYACLHFLHWIFKFVELKYDLNKFDLVYVRRQINE